MEAKEAFSALSEPKLRAEYDRQRQVRCPFPGTISGLLRRTRDVAGYLLSERS